MEVSGHQVDFILLHIWQEIPPAPTPTVFSSDLPQNARLEPRYVKERAPHLLHQVWTIGPQCYGRCTCVCVCVCVFYFLFVLFFLLLFLFNLIFF